MGLEGIHAPQNLWHYTPWGVVVEYPTDCEGHVEGLGGKGEGPSISLKNVQWQRGWEQGPVHGCTEEVHGEQ